MGARAWRQLTGSSGPKHLSSCLSTSLFLPPRGLASSHRHHRQQHRVVFRLSFPSCRSVRFCREAFLSSWVKSSFCCSRVCSGFTLLLRNVRASQRGANSILPCLSVAGTAPSRAPGHRPRGRLPPPRPLQPLPCAVRLPRLWPLLTASNRRSPTDVDFTSPCFTSVSFTSLRVPSEARDAVLLISAWPVPGRVESRCRMCADWPLVAQPDRHTVSRTDTWKQSPCFPWSRRGAESD